MLLKFNDNRHEIKRKLKSQGCKRKIFFFTVLNLSGYFYCVMDSVKKDNSCENEEGMKGLFK